MPLFRYVVPQVLSLQVMLFSYHASEQAHYNGRNLVVRKSCFYDFTFNKEEELQRIQDQQTNSLPNKSSIFPRDRLASKD